MSEIQSNTETPSTDSMPVLAKPTGDARADSRAQHDHFHALVKYFDANPSKGLTRDEVGNTVSAAPAVAPNADDAELVKATHADAFKRFNGNNPQVNAIVDRMYQDLHSGKPLDRQALSAAFSAAIQTPDSLADRAALDDLSKVLDADGGVRADQIPQRLLGDYTLPKDRVYDAESTVAGLKLARQMNLTQDQLDAYLAAQDADE